MLIYKKYEYLKSEFMNCCRSETRDYLLSVGFFPQNYAFFLGRFEDIKLSYYLTYQQPRKIEKSTEGVPVLSAIQITWPCLTTPTWELTTLQGKWFIFFGWILPTLIRNRLIQKYWTVSLQKMAQMPLIWLHITGQSNWTNTKPISTHYCLYGAYDWTIEANQTRSTLVLAKIDFKRVLININRF